jgi:hypothetical protein
MATGEFVEENIIFSNGNMARNSQKICRGAFIVMTNSTIVKVIKALLLNGSQPTA